MFSEETRLIDLTVKQFRKLIREEFANNKCVIQMGSFPSVETVPIEKLSELLGWSKSTIYKKCSLRQIPHFKVGKELRFNIEEVNHWISNTKRKTEEEVVIDFENKHRRTLKRTI